MSAPETSGTAAGTETNDLNTANLPSSSVITQDLTLDTDGFSGTPSDEQVSVISAFCAYGIDQTSFLSNLFSTDLPATTGSSATLSLAHARGQDAVVVNESPRNLIILNPEPFDSPKDANRDDARESSWHLSMSLCDVILFSVRMRDLSRFHSNGLSALGASLTQLLIVQEENLVPIRSKRAFFVLVRDHEQDVISRNELTAGFVQEMQTCFDQIAKPPRTPQRVTDIFEFHVIPLPSESLSPEGYRLSLAKLQDHFLDPASDEYLFENSAYYHDQTLPIAETVQNVWKKLQSEQTQDMPAKRELMSSFDCDNAMRKVYEKYQRGVRVWRREADGGVIIEKFGDAADEMVQQTMSVFDHDAGPHKGSPAFRRKRQELKDLLDADLYSLFVVQMAKLREVTLRVFKDKLDNLRESDANLEREVKAALKEGQRSFRNNAEALRPSFSRWRYDNDAKELNTKMREDATDKMQRARIAEFQESGGRRGRRRRAGMGAGGPKRRQPISLGIHYLDPAPFGFKDSRFEKLNEEDPMAYSTNALPAGGGSGGGSGGLSVPIMPGRNSGWERKNQDFIYTEKK